MKNLATKLFDKHARFIVREAEPFNAEPPIDLLRASFITPPELFYVRNHAPVPQVDADSFHLKIDGMVDRAIHVSLAELRAKFAPQTVTATLQCAGNRRDGLMAIEIINGEVAWGAQAIGNASWTGVSLRDVLEFVGIGADARHIEFTGLDDVERKGTRFGFGGSIPVDKAMSGEVLLAFEMNAEPLTPVHGAPLRAVVPGYIGARSVKWLGGIRVQGEPSQNYFQAHAYKLFSPSVSAQTADWRRGLMLGELSINSAICRPRDGETLRAGKCAVQGYAMAGGGRSVERVDVSGDNGQTWTEAKFDADGFSRWAWRFWEAQIELEAGESQIVARAWDSATNTQPEDARAVWNFKGYMNNAWHRVNVFVL